MKTAGREERREAAECTAADLGTAPECRCLGDNGLPRRDVFGRSAVVATREDLESPPRPRECFAATRSNEKLGNVGVQRKEVFQ